LDEYVQHLRAQKFTEADDFKEWYLGQRKALGCMDCPINRPELQWVSLFVKWTTEVRPK
jgi:hypothetical protein